MTVDGEKSIHWRWRHFYEQLPLSPCDCSSSLYHRGQCKTRDWRCAQMLLIKLPSFIKFIKFPPQRSRQRVAVLSENRCSTLGSKYCDLSQAQQMESRGVQQFSETLGGTSPALLPKPGWILYAVFKIHRHLWLLRSFHALKTRTASPGWIKSRRWKYPTASFPPSPAPPTAVYSLGESRSDEPEPLHSVQDPPAAFRDSWKAQTSQTHVAA